MNIVAQSVNILHFIDVRTTVFLKTFVDIQAYGNQRSLICDLRTQSRPAKLTYLGVNYPTAVNELNDVEGK